jgi:hypothetical protein
MQPALEAAGRAEGWIGAVLTRAWLGSKCRLQKR